MSFVEVSFSPTHRFNLERDVADARAQVAATIEAEKKSIERAKAADKKIEEAKIVFSASKHEAVALQSKIKSLTSELSAAQAQLLQTSAALAEETRLRRVCVEELQAIKSQAATDAAALKEQLQNTDCSRSVFEARAEELSATAHALQEEVKQVHAAAAAQLIQLEATLVETKAAHASETADLKLRLTSSEKMCSIHQQQHQQESSRQERERLFVEQKLAKLEEQQSAAAAAESAAAVARAEAERSAAAATERIAAVSAVFKKMANLDEGMEGDCTCLQCMQTLADPVLLQVIFVPLQRFILRAKLFALTLLQCGHSLCASCAVAARACAECDAAIVQVRAMLSQLQLISLPLKPGYFLASLPMSNRNQREILHWGPLFPS